MRALNIFFGVREYYSALDVHSNEPRPSLLIMLFMLMMLLMLMLLMILVMMLMILMKLVIMLMMKAIE